MRSLTTNDDSTTETSPLRAVVHTASGSTYRVDGDDVVLDGPGRRPYSAFTLVSMKGGRLVYTDGRQVFRSSEIVSLSAA